MTKEPSELFLLSKRALNNSHRWFGDTGKDRDLMHLAVGLGGETGELLNVIKKIDRKSIKITDATTQYALGMEAADVFIYLLNICGLLNIDLMEAYNQVTIKNEQRFMKERQLRDVDKVKEIADGINVRRKVANE